MPAKPKQPKARVMWANDNSYEANLSSVTLMRDAPTAAQRRAYSESPVLVIPFPSRQSAAKACKFWNLKEEQRVERGAARLYEISRTTIRAALEPKRRKAFKFIPWSQTSVEQRKWYKTLARAVLSAIGGER